MTGGYLDTASQDKHLPASWLTERINNGFNPEFTSTYTEHVKQLEVPMQKGEVPL